MVTDTASAVQEPGLYSTTESAGIKVVAMATDAVLEYVQNIVYFKYYGF